MLRAHQDQENLVSIHQANAATKQHGTTRTLQPKTPGARYPKTPLKVPLNDENVVRGLGGKSILTNKTKGDRAQWQTPAEPRTERPVLGDKTTNTKARQQAIGKTPAIGDIEKSQVKPTTVSRPKPAANKVDSSKLQILQDITSDPLSTEPDTNAPPPEPLPYESDVWPDGVLTFDGIRPQNRLKGHFEYYHNRKDENGTTRLDREMEAARVRRHKEAEAKIKEDMEQGFKWDLGLLESPKKKKVVPVKDLEATDKLLVRPGATRAPPTIASRRAASALGMAGKTPTTSTTSTTNLQRKPLAPQIGCSYQCEQVAELHAAHQGQASTAISSRRSASSALHDGAAQDQQHVHSRSEARSRVFSRTASGASDSTVTPASYAKDNASPKPDFVSIFDVTPRPDEDESGNLFGNGGGGADDLFGAIEHDEDDFQLQLSP
ncbi:hypothetical protein INS49_014425 [Diaporthe citri]|uniref:uncharacterized protein n=1 Tax=Diaporthe citri TaxID=83186 RepID=UPI001C820702|nr:uncharacterized protein INS49_014425 [Diaporthe citri]KAG6356552.1 hypothetical protein INS49_014425 [Diaporthe citri]